MNLLLVKEGTIFLPMQILGIQLALFKSLEEIKFPASSNHYNINWSSIFAGMNLLSVMEGTIFLPMRVSTT
jgi:hypothetical protein